MVPEPILVAQLDREIPVTPVMETVDNLNQTMAPLDRGRVLDYLGHLEVRTTKVMVMAKDMVIPKGMQMGKDLPMAMQMVNHLEMPMVEMPQTHGYLKKDLEKQKPPSQT